MLHAPFAAAGPCLDIPAAVMQRVKAYDLVEMAMLVRKLDGSRVVEQVGWLADVKRRVKRAFASRV